jgi:hypothetical protein
VFWSRPTWPEVSQDIVRPRARLLVIDDRDFPYLELFERDSYNIKKWNDVDNLKELESGAFDVILLDLHGVGKAQSAEQGLGVLRHLRLAAPSQVILAYSDADWSLKYQEFFRLADSVLSKSSDYVDFKRAVDAAIKKRFSLEFYVERIASVVGTDASSARDFSSSAQKAILTRKPAKLEKYLLRVGLDQQKVATAMSIAQTAIAILDLLFQLKK